MRQMLGKPKLPFIFFDSKALDQEFYSGYDERFLHRKVKILGALLENSQLLESFMDAETAQDERGRMLHSLAAEILFTEFHQFESFFAILLAPFQPLPHWIYLNTYSTGDIRSKARQFVKGAFNDLLNDQAADRNTFLRSAVYQGYAGDAGSAEAWDASFDNLWWIIYRMAEKYIDAEEYNSYKHGLRMMSASSTMALSSNPVDLSNAFVMRSPNSITHLKFKKGTNGTSVSIETKAFNPLESQAHVRLMADILANIKRIRLAALTGQERVEVMLYSKIDREALQKLATCQKWASPA